MSITSRFMRNKTIGVKILDDRVMDATEPTFVSPSASTEDPMEGVRVAAAYADVAKDLITHAALTIGGVFAACKIIERICK